MPSIKIPKRFYIEKRRQSNQKILEHTLHNKKLEKPLWKNKSLRMIWIAQLSKSFFTWSGKLFHSSEAATEKERRPYWVDVEEHVRRVRRAKIARRLIFLDEFFKINWCRIVGDIRLQEVEFYT